VAPAYVTTSPIAYALPDAHGVAAAHAAGLKAWPLAAAWSSLVRHPTAAARSDAERSANRRASFMGR
jgi:hypothetical protein